MSDACDHDWHRSDLMGCSVCPRCHGVRFHDEPPPEPHEWENHPPGTWGIRCAKCHSTAYGTVDRYCPAPGEPRTAVAEQCPRTGCGNMRTGRCSLEDCPPVSSPPAPASADMLDRALGGSGSFDAIDRRFKR